MASRAELKRRAKAHLREYYWMAFAVCLISGLFGGGLFRGVSTRVGLQNTQAETGTNTLQEMMGSLSLGQTVAVLSVILIVLVISWVLATAWNVFIGNAVQVGRVRFFVASRDQGQSAGIGSLLFAFNGGSYLNVVKTEFMHKLFVALWTLLLIIPGIIKSYEYAMVPYILSENPQMPWRDALRLSKDMMDGNKGKLFVLNLSFIGWILLGTLACGFGVLFVSPYIDAANAEFYADLRGNFSGSSGYVYY